MGRSERGSERFVQWNEALTQDLDITNLVGQGSTIFGKKKTPTKIQKSVVGDRGVMTPSRILGAALRTPTPPQVKLPRQTPARRFSPENHNDEDDDDFASPVGKLCNVN